jgi:hypothetical protein
MKTELAVPDRVSVPVSAIELVDVYTPAVRVLDARFCPVTLCVEGA